MIYFDFRRFQTKITKLDSFLSKESFDKLRGNQRKMDLKSFWLGLFCKKV